MGRLVVFYDGWCPLCTRVAQLWKRLDFLNQLQLVSFRDPSVVRALGVDLQRAERRMICRSPLSNDEYEGFDAIIQVALRLPPFWPFIPMLLSVRLLGFGQPLYDFIASRRAVLPVGNCSGNACGIRAEPDMHNLNGT